MSTSDNLTFRPAVTGNAAMDSAWRQVFDYVYQLRSQVEDLQNRVKALEDAQ